MPNLPDISSLLARVPSDLHAKVNNYWQTWQAACKQKNINHDPVVDPALLGYVFACSEFVATTICRHPQFWHQLNREGLLHKSLTLADYQQLHQQRIICRFNR